MKPIVYDLYCGLGGWAEGFLSEGYECIGYDIEKHDYGTGTYPSHMIGGGIELSSRLGCTRYLCFRLGEQFYLGHILQQGDQYCDGSIEPRTCGPRLGAIGDGFTLSFHIEFPRHRYYGDYPEPF
jgi:hypothetical protein